MTDELIQDVVKDDMEAVTTLTPEAIEAALNVIKQRSFSGRNPELGKMFKCQVCGLRHRGVQCTQKFVKDTEGNEKSLDRVTQTRKTILGAKYFEKRRHHPHPNKRKLRFVEIVRELVPDEYTQEDLQAARKKAARILAKVFGRYRILPPITKHKEQNVEPSVDRNQDIPAQPEAV